MFYRLIKPDWGKTHLKKEVDGKVVSVPNPDFVRTIQGPDTLGDEEFSEMKLKELNEQGYGVYHFINHPAKKPNHKFLSGKDIDVFNAVFIDMDLKDKIYASKDAFLEVLSKFPVKPSMVVSSGNGVHAYWWVSNADRESHMYTQFVLIQHFKTDSSVWTPLQLMRAPGTLNTKDPDNFKPVEILTEHSSDKSYQIEELIAHLPDITEDHAKKMTRHIDALEGRSSKEFESEVPIDQLPEKFLKDIKKNKTLNDLFEDPAGTCGDRSSADMKLANLLFTLDYDRGDALQVLLNTKKARTRADRFAYAHGTLDKVYTDRPKFVVKNALERQNDPGAIKNLGHPIKGPRFWDCLHSPWRTKQVLGLIGGSGIGKTTCTLEIMRASFENDPESDDIAVLFSLEMTEGEIFDNWRLLTDGDPKMASRLYVVANEDDEGNGRHIGLQEILWYCRDIQKSTGKKIRIIGIDHVDAVSRHIDVKKNNFFKLEGMDRETFYGDTITISKKTICAQIKNLAKKLDVFVVLQSQTTKAKDSGGDVPLGKNAAYGVSEFEWYSDYIITLWRPLKRVQHKTHLRATGWQYCKIRKKHKKDDVEENTHYLLKFDPETTRLSDFPDNEMADVNKLIQDADILRKMDEKQVSTTYLNSPAIKRLELIYKKKEA